MPDLFEQYAQLYPRFRILNDQYENAKKRLAGEADDPEARERRIEELEEQIKKLGEYRDEVETYRIAARKKLTSLNILTITPRELNFTRLNNWAYMMDPTAVDDPYAQRIYVQCECNLMYLNLKEQEYRAAIEDLKNVKAPTQDELLASVRAQQKQILAEYSALLLSEEFSTFVKDLRAAHENYTLSSRLQSLAQEAPAAGAKIGIGAYGQSLPIPEEARPNAAARIGEWYDRKDSMVYLPVEEDLEREVLIRVLCTRAREKNLYNGLQNLILARLAAYPAGHTIFTLLDAVHLNSSALGELRPLEGSGILEEVPRESEAITDRLREIVAEFGEIDEQIGMFDSLEEYNTANEATRLPHRMLILIGYPGSFSQEAKDLVRRVLSNYERYGISVVMTDSETDERTEAREIPDDIVGGLYRIRMNRQTDMLSKNHSQERSFRWYEWHENLAPSFVTQVRKHDPRSAKLGNEYDKRIDISGVPQYTRGKKDLVLPYAVDQKDAIQSISFTEENFASFLMGASGSGKSTLLHDLITGVMLNFHPDDVELWLADFKMSEFAQYMNPLPPHVKYILLDESEELVYDLVDKLTEEMMRRQRYFMQPDNKGKKKVENVPANEYMPVLFVILDEFSIMLQSIAEDESYRLKLQNLLAKGRALGIKFLFSSQTFLNGIRGLTPTAKAQIQCRIAMKNTRPEIEETLELSAAMKTDIVKNWMDALPPHYVLYKYREGDGVVIKKLHVLYFKGTKENAYIEQKGLIERINGAMHCVPEDQFNPADITAYVDKQPVIVDGNSYDAFKPAQIREDIEALRSASGSDMVPDDAAFVVGTPRRMERTRLSVLTSEARENILLISRASEQACTASILLTIMKSMKLQNKNVRIWAYSRNRLYKAYRNSHFAEFERYEDMDAICDEIRALKKKIIAGETGSDLIVLIGMERICGDFEFMEGGSGKTGAAAGQGGTEAGIERFKARKAAQDAANLASGAVAVDELEKWKAGQAAAWGLSAERKALSARLKTEGKSKDEIRASMTSAREAFFKDYEEKHPKPAAVLNEGAGDRPAEVEAGGTTAAETEQEHELEPTGAYNAADDLAYIIRQGSRLGYHFLAVLNNYSDIKVMGIKRDVFRYRMSFQTSVEESREIFDSKLASALPEHVCQYSDTIDRYSFRPYIHPGIGWDGWYINEATGETENAFS